MEAVQITPKSQDIQLQEQFAPFEAQAQKWMRKAKSIKVEDASQVELMAGAKEARLALRKIRIEVGNKHTELKAEALAYTQNIDKIKRTLVGLIEPIEAHLQEQEDFVKTQEANRKKELIVKRATAMVPYMSYEDACQFPLGEMGEEAFENMLGGYKAAREKKIKDEEDARLAQVKRDQEAAAERKRITEENAKLKAENDKQEAKLKKERDEVKRLKDEAEEKRLKDEQEKKDAANAKRRAARAPDKDKLVAFSNAIGELKCADLASDEARDIVLNSWTLLRKVQKYITDNANKL